VKDLKVKQAKFFFLHGNVTRNNIADTS